MAQTLTETPAAAGPLPVWLMDRVARDRVVVFCSELTDIRRLEQRLAAADMAYAVERMGMGSQAMRARFGGLREFTRWPTLPQVFLDRRFIGGEPELAVALKQAAAGPGAPVPAPALWLGVAGLVPFVAGAAALTAPGGAGAIWGPVTFAYGAAILAFLGGVQWGAAVGGDAAGPRAWLRYGASVLAPLAAWVAALLSGFAGAALLVAGFVVVYLWDEWLGRAGELPAWYLRLRRGLTAVVVLCLMWVTAAALGVASPV